MIFQTIRKLESTRNSFQVIPDHHSHSFNPKEFFFLLYFLRFKRFGFLHLSLRSQLAHITCHLSKPIINCLHFCSNFLKYISSLYHSENLFSIFQIENLKTDFNVFVTPDYLQDLQILKSCVFHEGRVTCCDSSS